MAEVLLPTTRAQVSGHKFLQRRMEHALVLGDLRMIHDPLARQRRALLFGVTALVLVALGAGLLALVRPTADPGEALIMRSDSGALFVRVEETVHPVTNLASARLIVGEAAEPERIADEILLDHQLGAPVGLTDAPEVLTGKPPPELSWSVCHEAETDRVAVLVRPAGAGVPAPVGENHAVLARLGDEDHLLTAAGRRQLPEADTPVGRVVRRQLGISPRTPRWGPGPEILRVVHELPPVAAPEGQLQLYRVPGQDWLDLGRGLLPVTPLQLEMLADLGAAVEPLSRGRASEIPDDPDPPTLTLPERKPQWIDPADGPLCATGEAGTPGTLDQLPRGVALAGDSVAEIYAGPALGSVVTDTGAGYRVVAETGTVHPVPAREVLGVLGLPAEPSPVSWQLLRLLPQGVELHPDRAVRVRDPTAGDGAGAE